jgi:hypothetical protein
LSLIPSLLEKKYIPSLNFVGILAFSSSGRLRQSLFSPAERSVRGGTGLQQGATNGEGKG